MKKELTLTIRPFQEGDRVRIASGPHAERLGLVVGREAHADKWKAKLRVKVDTPDGPKEEVFDPWRCRFRPEGESKCR